MAIKYLDAKRLQGTNAERLAMTSGATDSMGSSADGTNNGAELDTDDEKLGTGCLDFDINDYVACNGVVSGLTTKGTISAWCNFNTLDVGGDGGGKVCAFGDADANTFIELSFTAAGALSGQGRLSGTKQWTIKTDDGRLSTSGWYHVVLSHDGTEPKLYVNGIEDTDRTLETQNAFWVSLATGLDEFRLGMQFHSSTIDGKFDGLMDDVGIWNDALIIGTDEDTADSIKWLYNDGDGRLASTIPTGLKAYYNCDSDSATIDNNAVAVYPKLPNGTIFNETNAYKYFMFDGTDTWNQMVSS